MIMIKLKKNLNGEVYEFTLKDFKDMVKNDEDELDDTRRSSSIYFSLFQ